MGGKCLKSTITERKTTEQFYDIQSRLIPKLKEIFETDIHVLKFYRSKAEHGDMDILLKIDDNFYNKKINISENIEKHFSPNEIVINDGTTTFDFERFQIDLSPVDHNIWESTKFWMDYDPTSNLLGKIFRSIIFDSWWLPGKTICGHLKYKPDGLYAIIYNKSLSNKLGEILITNDTNKMFTFIGLDINRKYNGFDTLEDIYDWIISCKYFKPQIFFLENLNQDDRKRNKKRPTFCNFLKFIENFQFDKEKLTNEVSLDLINSSFPESHLLEQIEALKKQDEKTQNIKLKFNGKLVMEWTGLKDKELGNIIKKYRQLKGEQFFIETEKDLIKLDFHEFFNNQNNNN